jgi:hypothetical protein
MSIVQHLPSELWETILKRLDFISIVKCMRVSPHQMVLLPNTDRFFSFQVCKELYDAIEESPLLNYIIELGVAGYIDNPAYVASPAQRILLLAERIRYWKDMTWSEKITSEPRGTLSQHPKDVIFSRGTILRTEPLGTTGKKVYEITSIKTGNVDIARPSLPFNIEPTQVVLNMDVGQDLLVLLQITVITECAFLFHHISCSSQGRH